MFKAEEKILKWVENHMLLFCLVAATLCSLVIRCSMWEYFIDEENLVVSYVQGCKIISMIFDYMLAGVVGYWVYDWKGRQNCYLGVLAYACVIFYPVVIMNSAAWGQCGAVAAFLVVASLLAFSKEKHVIAFVMYGIALALQVQVLFVLPFFLFAYFVKKKFTFLYYGILLLAYGATSVLYTVLGVPGELTTYFAQLERESRLYDNYPSFWALLSTGEDTAFLYLKVFALAFAVVVLGGILIYWLVKKVQLTAKNMLYMAFLVAYTCALFLPGVQDSYSYCYEILAIIIVFLNRRTLPGLLLLCGISFSTYGSRLYYSPMNMPVLVLLNLVAYVSFFYTLNREMT